MLRELWISQRVWPDAGLRKHLPKRVSSGGLYPGSVGCAYEHTEWDELVTYEASGEPLSRTTKLTEIFHWVLLVCRIILVVYRECGSIFHRLKKVEVLHSTVCFMLITQINIQSNKVWFKRIQINITSINIKSFNDCFWLSHTSEMVRYKLILSKIDLALF